MPTILVDHEGLAHTWSQYWLLFPFYKTLHTFKRFQGPSALAITSFHRPAGDWACVVISDLQLDGEGFRRDKDLFPWQSEEVTVAELDPMATQACQRPMGKASSTLPCVSPKHPVLWQRAGGCNELTLDSHNRAACWMCSNWQVAYHFLALAIADAFTSTAFKALCS